MANSEHDTQLPSPWGEPRGADSGDHPLHDDDPPVSDPPPARRAGGWALTLLAGQLTLPVLRALREGPMRLAELRRAVGMPPQTTLRSRLATLVEAGVLAKRPREDGSHASDFELRPLGREMLDVAAAVEAWLERAPEGAMRFDTGTARTTVKALVDGWATRMLRLLAAEPRSLTELDRAISDFNYPAIERRLGNMRAAGLVAPLPAPGPSVPYEVTEWGRRGVVPVARAVRCERMHVPERTPAPTPADFETALLLAVPLAELPATTSGGCQLRVEGGGDSGSGSGAGVQVEIEEGEVVSCGAQLAILPNEWATGTERCWLEALASGDLSHLRLDGPGRVAEQLVEAIHEALTAPPPRRG